MRVRPDRSPDKRHAHRPLRRAPISSSEAPDLTPGLRLIGKEKALAWWTGHSMTPKQVRAARALVGWSQADLAKEAGLGITTISDCELERRRTSFKTMGAIREALERNGVQFTFGKRPGVRLRA